MISLEDALDLIPDKKSDLVSAFDLLSTRIAICSNDEYDVHFGRIKRLLDDIDCIGARDCLYHVFNGMLQAAEYYHPQISTGEEDE